jgi:hypothetical protein
MAFGELLIILVILGVLLGGGVALLVLLVRGTAQQTKMGINLTPPSACPKCGEPLPAIRAPKNFRQAMWGGWTCSRCQTELDKWGRVVS